MGRNNRIEKKIDKLLESPEIKFPEDEVISKYILPPASLSLLDDLEEEIVPFIHNIKVRIGLTPESLSEDEISEITRISKRYNKKLVKHGLEPVEPTMFGYVYCSFAIVALRVTQTIPNSEIGPIEKMQLEIEAQRVIHTISFRLISNYSAKHKILKAFDHILRVCDRQNVFQECAKLMFEIFDGIDKEYNK